MVFKIKNITANDMRKAMAKKDLLSSVLREIDKGLKLAVKNPNWVANGLGFQLGHLGDISAIEDDLFKILEMRGFKAKVNGFSHNIYVSWKSE